MYDLNSNLTRRVDRLGRATDFSYDALNRRVGETWLDANLLPLHEFTYSFDAAGQLLAAGDDAAEYEYTYDDLGRTTEISQSFAALSSPIVFAQTFDAAGRRTQLAATIGTTSDFVNDFSYDLLRRLTRLEQHGLPGGAAVAEKRVDFSYNALGQFSQIARFADLDGGSANEVATTNFAYDGYHRLASLVHTHDTDELAGYYYSWDRNDRITRIDYTSIVAGPTSSTFSYDVTNQLTAADHSSQTDEEYEYDQNGNRITANGASYSTGANNQLLSDGTFNYTYDAEGQRLTRTRIPTDPADDHLVEYSWNHRGELASVTFKNNSGTLTKTAEYTYDVFGRRISKAVDADGPGPAAAAVEHFVYDGEHIALVFDGQSSLTNRYLHGPVIDQILADEQFSPVGPDELPSAPGDVYWALVDHLGTVHDLADSSGAVAKHLTYDSFGVIVSDTAPTLHHRFGYTAREFDDETGNHYYRARYYDAPAARFLSEDPIQDDYQNLSRYVRNNPLTATDPSGLEPLQPGGYYNSVYGPKWTNKNWKTPQVFAPPYDALIHTPLVKQGHYAVRVRLAELAIPRVELNATCPAHVPERGVKFVSPYAQRVDLRRNLMHYKIPLVKAIAGMLRTTPPNKLVLMDNERLASVSIRLTERQLEDIANVVADWYIQTVDSFLIEHWGAKPQLGQRGLLADMLGLENNVSSPWCADWAAFVLEKSQDMKGLFRVEVGGVDWDLEIHKLLRFDGAQHITPDFQHNFVVISPRGHQISGQIMQDAVLLILDPWITLQPMIYDNSTHPSPPTSLGLRIGD